jgi:hypothetical protein
VRAPIVVTGDRIHRAPLVRQPDQPGVLAVWRSKVTWWSSDAPEQEYGLPCSDVQGVALLPGFRLEMWGEYLGHYYQAMMVGEYDCALESDQALTCLPTAEALRLLEEHRLGPLTPADFALRVAFDERTGEPRFEEQADLRDDWVRL